MYFFRPAQILSTPSQYTWAAQTTAIPSNFCVFLFLANFNKANCITLGYCDDQQILIVQGHQSRSYQKPKQ